MKRRFLLSIAIALPLVLALSSWLLPESRIAGASSFHQDPRVGLSIADAGLAIRLAGLMLGAIALESTGEIQNLTASIREANLPLQLRLFASAVARLIQELHDILSQLNTTFSEIDGLNDLRDAKAAREKLATARALVQRGQQINDDLAAALTQLVLSVAGFNRVLPEATAELEQANRKLEEYWQRYLTRLAALERTTATLVANSIPTTLDFRSDQTSVFVGQGLPVSGTLNANGNGLGNMHIDFLLDGERIGSTTTTADGSFAPQIQIPLRYTPEARLVARFVPERFEPPYYEGASAQVIIRLSYYATTLTFQAPTSAYPGRPFTLKVNTTPLMPGAVSHDMNITVAGSPAGRGQCNGTCEITVQVPDGAPLGVQQLGVTVMPSDLYSGAVGSSAIPLIQGPVLLQFEASLLAFVPGGLHIAGSVSSLFGNQDGGQVTLRLGNLSQSAPVANGKFTEDMELPFSFFIAGLQTLDVSYQPGSPWLAPTRQSRKVLVANVVNIAVFIMLLGLAGIIMTTKRSAARALQQASLRVTEILVSPELREEIGSPMPARSRTKVVESYWRAVRFIELVLGVGHPKSATLREFGRAVERHHKSVAAPLNRLTAVAEESLYSQRSPSASQAEEAKQQLEEVKRSLNDA